MNRPGSLRLLAAAVAVGVTAGLLLTAGCGRQPHTISNDKRATEAKADPWEEVGRRLRKDTDPAACKAALDQLNSDLASRSDVDGPPALTPAAEKALAALVPLTPEDVAEIRGASYSALDPVYLADCFYLRDAARSLDPAGLPPADLARVGFAWVCRQVSLNPWPVAVQPGVLQATALPPTYVLRRGSGSGLERAYVFLALLQQMGLDGCLIGPPDAADRPAGFVEPGPDGKPTTTYPKGPFWAVGARIGADVLLFEPWRGEPFPGPGGKGVGTLAQVKANPDQLKAWHDDKAQPWDVTPDQVKAAAVFLAGPVSGLSPRMATLDEKVKADTGARLGVDPTALRDRFTAAAPTGPGLPAAGVKYWNPPGDRFAYGRTTATFLPSEEGGRDRSDPAVRVYTQYYQSLLPAALQDVPEGLRREPADRLVTLIRGNYGQAFFAPPTPRERIQRGQFQDAARDLTDKQQQFGRGLERLRTESPGEVAAFVAAANEEYEGLNRARYPAVGQTTPEPDTNPGVAAARQAVDTFWRANAPTAQLIVDRATAAAGRAEASFLLALAKHEEAERQQLRAGRAGADARAKAAAATAWAEAAGAWAAHLEQSGNVQGFPGRAAHARALADRARKLAAAK